MKSIFKAYIEAVPQALIGDPLVLNSHLGRDYFSFSDNCRIIEAWLALTDDVAAYCTVETHRARFTSGATSTIPYLERYPELRLNADFSHWFSVHESDLSDQEPAVEYAINRASYIHARVGFDQGPQLLYPLSEHSAPWFERHLALWKRIIAARKVDGYEWLVITPEAGTPPYMPVDENGDPIQDVWQVNVEMMNRLKKELAL